MNAMPKFSYQFPQAESICEIHNQQKVRLGGHDICPACAENYTKQQNESYERDVQRRAFRAHMSTGMLPERHQNSGFGNYVCELPGQTLAFNKCVEYANSIMGNQVTNLVMVGKTGTGKTHLACATARTLLKNGKKARYITSEEIAQRIMQAWDKDTKDKSEKSVVYEFSQYDLLIVDEYGLHDRDKRKELVHKVLYARYDAGKPTMLISNMSLYDTTDRMGKVIHGLISDLGDRLWSRFQHGGLTQVECVWADARTTGGQA